MNQSYINEINKYINKLQNCINNIDRNEIDTFIKLLKKAQSENKHIYIMGNGGSATTASHFTCDINKPADLSFNRRLKVTCLNDNISTITAYANDVSFEDVFSEQLKNVLNEGDLVIALSGSGNSPNLVKAVEYANSKNAATIALTGYDGGKLQQISHYSVNANINDMQVSQDIHLMLVHIAMQIIYNLH